MGKKGKKKGKGGKAKKKSGKGENEMTLKEAMLAFQIQVKEKAAEELRYEIQGLKEQNKRYRERNERLKEEQLIHIKTLLRQAKEQELELEQHEVYNGEHVEQALRDKWDAAKEEEKQLDELRINIDEINKEYKRVNTEVEFWSEYRDLGSIQHKMQIELLEDEVEDMKNSFNDMCSHLKRQLDAAKFEVKVNMESCMAEQKYLASEKAMEQLDPASAQEVHENEWLKREAEIHRAERKELIAKLEELERENLQTISDLLDCRQDDLKISRRFYMTQFSEDDVLNDESLHDMDLRQLSVYQEGYGSPTASTPAAIEDRPKSAILQAVEDRVFSITGLREQDEEEEEEEEEEDLDEEDVGEIESDVIAHQDEYINIDEDEDFLHLGPLEIKLLCVSGQKKPIHPMDAREEIVDGSRPDITVTRPRWPIQTPMIRAALQGRRHSGYLAATKETL